MPREHDPGLVSHPTGGAAVDGSAQQTGTFWTNRGSFIKYAWIVVLFTAFVVVFGAFVRGSLSGDGCGNSWPLCAQPTIEEGSVLKRTIEFTHRITSGFLGLMAIWLMVWAFKAFPKGSAVRKAATYTLVFVVTEGLLGAALVLFGWVVHDKSVARLVTMPLHLVNTFALMLSATMAAYLAKPGNAVKAAGQGAVGTAVKVALGAFLVLGMTGAISAMGKTAYEAELRLAQTFSQKVEMHVGQDAPIALRGGALHPLVAISAGLLVVLAVRLVMDRRNGVPGVALWGNWSVGLFLGQFALGVFNLALSAPLWLQLVHLALAVANWITLVMLMAVSFRPQEAVEAEPEPTRPPMGLAETVRQYVALTKPRVISLLLFTTLAAMFAAKQGNPGLTLILVVMVGGYMAAGSANTYNMVVERDLDVAMDRTSHRPTVTHTVSNRQALTFATVLGVGSFVLLWAFAHPLAAWMALCGLLCYVFVYTLWLKRRTWHNIVIGGAAGAFPPLVGWAAVTGELSMFAWFMFALVFTWTPVHFWALALLIKEDYAKAGVPMLPVVKGDHVTVVQIVLYAVITTVLCAMPVLQGAAGPVYLAGAGLLNTGLLALSVGLLRETTKAKARVLFKFSMVYLALIFIVMVVDRVVSA